MAGSATVSRSTWKTSQMAKPAVITRRGPHRSDRAPESQAPMATVMP